MVKHLPKEHPNIPSTLPTEDIANIVELQASRVVSLMVEVHEAREKQLRDLKRGQAQKYVTNVTVKAKDKKIEFAAWGKHAEFMSGKVGIVRLDAASVIPAQSKDKASAKLTTLDSSKIVDATHAESQHLR